MKKLTKQICIMLAIMLCIIQPLSIEASKTESSDSSSWPAGPDKGSLTAESAILADASTGLVLYEKNADKRQYPASITKVMTALVAIENSSLDEVVTYSKNAVYGIEPGSSHIAVEVGEKLTMEQSLYAMLLESANEVCLGVAEHIAGSVEAFVDMMNARAKELGCKNTHFVNPNGLHNDKHYTTARDMALIARAAIQNSTFRKITGTKQYTIPKTNKKGVRNWIKNHHQMLNPYKYPKYEYDNCIGGKTGYTTKAQSTLVTYAKKKDVTLIAVVLKDLGPAYPSNEYTDTRKLFSYGFKNFSMYNVTKGDSATQDSGLFTKYSALLNDEDPLIYLKSGTKIILPKNISFDDVTQDITYDDTNNLQEGENVIGTIRYSYNKKTLGTCSVLYHTSDLTQLTTNADVTKTPDNKPVHEKKSSTANKTAFAVALSIIIVGCIYYFFIIRQRQRRRAYRRRRRSSNYDSNNTTHY